VALDTLRHYFGHYLVNKQNFSFPSRKRQNIQRMTSKPVKMPVPKDTNVVKIAVEMADQNPQLISFNQKQPLTTIIQDLCSGWGLTDPEQYALQVSR